MTKTDIWSKIKMAAAAILNLILKNGHNSVAVACIGTTFDVETETDLQKTDVTTIPYHRDYKKRQLTLHCEDIL